MSGRKQIFVIAGMVLSVSLIVSVVTALCVSCYDSRRMFDLLNRVCKEVAAQEPKTKQMISVVLKESMEDAGRNIDAEAEDDFLSALGYHGSEFFALSYGRKMLFAAAGFAGGFLFLFTFFYRNRIEAMRVRALTRYLEQVPAGRAAILSTSGEDDFSKLEDEIYKTVTFLYQTKDAAVRAKDDFAQNLSNIAHQIKTPMTAISLCVQMLKQESDSHYLAQVEKQIVRLTHLEEALLLLSRMDAGTLLLHKQETDVYTMLVLAADHLQELCVESGVSIEIPQLGRRMITIDPDWTMEAMMNLMKNCMEHSRSKIVHCSYAQNSLYTQILVWDDGEGFYKEDLPHLFERFYRGQRAGAGGIGIGLALSKEIIEQQNGTIRAENRRDGGALFEIRFYSH